MGDSVIYSLLFLMDFLRKELEKLPSIGVLFLLSIETFGVRRVSVLLTVGAMSDWVTTANG
jgi:hypothetical protein